MQQFIDDKNRTWEIVANVGTLRRVRSTLADRSVDLLKLDEGKPPLVARLSVDFELLVDVIYELLSGAPQPQELAVEDFVSGLGGDGLANAAKAFWQELSDFFQKLGRTDTVEVVQTQLRLLQAVVEDHRSKIAAIDIVSLMELEERNPQTLGNSSTSSPGSPESTQTPAQLAN